MYPAQPVRAAGRSPFPLRADGDDDAPAAPDEGTRRLVPGDGAATATACSTGARHGRQCYK